MRPAGGEAVKPVAIVCVPGLYATFYDPPYIALGRELAALGYGYLVGHDRGHGFGAVLRHEDGRPVCGGGGWERPEDSALDAGAWIATALDGGFRAVALPVRTPQHIRNPRPRRRTS